MTRMRLTTRATRIPLDKARNMDGIMNVRSPGTRPSQNLKVKGTKHRSPSATRDRGHEGGGKTNGIRRHNNSQNSWAPMSFCCLELLRP